MIERFTDGNMADVYRIGDVVRKQKGPWWDATRQILQHLGSVGYPWSQRIVQEDSDTVDFTYIAGDTVLPDLTGCESIDFLRTIGLRARELHNALDGFRLTPDTETVPWPVRPQANAIICHNDLSPWNTVVHEGEFRGFIDWDLVSYGTREWELAWMCWRWGPIYSHGERIQFTAEQQADRCRILLESYGLDAIELTGFVDMIDLRMECGLESVEQLGAQGVPGFDRLLATGMHLSAHDDRAWLKEHREVFVSQLERG